MPWELQVVVNEDPKTRVIRELREEIMFLRNQIEMRSADYDTEAPHVASNQGMHIYKLLLIS